VGQGAGNEVKAESVGSYALFIMLKKMCHAAVLELLYNYFS